MRRPRKYPRVPRVPLTTELGPVMATFTDAGHVHVSTDGAHVNDDNPCLAYRGQEYRVSVNLFADAGPDLPAWSERPDGYRTITRRPQWTDAPRTYAAAIVDAITAAVRAYVAEHPETLRAAELSDVSSELIQAEEKRDKLRADLDEAESSVSRLLARLESLGDAT